MKTWQQTINHFPKCWDKQYARRSDGVLFVRVTTYTLRGNSTGPWEVARNDEGDAWLDENYKIIEANVRLPRN